MKFKKAPIAASLALCLLMVGAVGTTAFAASPDSSALPATSPQAQTQAAEVAAEQDSAAADTDNVNDEQDNETDHGTEADAGKETETDTKDVQAQADLAAQAKITEAEAIAAAEQANSGYTFTANWTARTASSPTISRAQMQTVASWR